MKLPVEESEYIPCDFLDAVSHLRRYNPSAPIRFSEALNSTVTLLSVMPHLGRLRPELGTPGTRSWRVIGFRNYLLFYEALPDRVRLLRLLHGSRDLQTELGK